MLLWYLCTIRYYYYRSCVLCESKSFFKCNKTFSPILIHTFGTIARNFYSFLYASLPPESISNEYLHTKWNVKVQLTWTFYLRRTERTDGHKKRGRAFSQPGLTDRGPDWLSWWPNKSHRSMEKTFRWPCSAHLDGRTVMQTDWRNPYALRSTFPPTLVPTLRFQY